MDAQSQQILLRVQQRAVACVNQAAVKFHLLLDWTEASIPRVEYALGEIHKQIGAKADQNKATIVALSNGFGSYIGEMLRKKHGGHWCNNLPNSPADLEGLEVNGVVFSPMVCVFFRITNGVKYNVVEFYKRTAAAIGRSRPAVTPSPAVGMGDFAVKAVAEAKERFGIGLDYSEASLDGLDQVLRELHNLLTDQVPDLRKLSSDELEWNSGARSFLSHR